MKNTLGSLFVTTLCYVVIVAFPAAAQDGTTGEPNIAQLRAAAEAGDATAQFQLGSAYQTGDGVRENDTEGVKWMTMAASQGNPDAQFKLGIAYRGGFGVEQSNAMAYMWFDLAAQQEHEGATQARMELYYSMTNEQIAEAKKLIKNWKPTTSR